MTQVLENNMRIDPDGYAEFKSILGNLRELMREKLPDNKQKKIAVRHIENAADSARDCFIMEEVGLKPGLTVGEYRDVFYTLSKTNISTEQVKHNLTELIRRKNGHD